MADAFEDFGQKVDLTARIRCACISGLVHGPGQVLRVPVCSVHACKYLTSSVAMTWWKEARPCKLEAYVTARAGVSAFSGAFCSDSSLGRRGLSQLQHCCCGRLPAALTG